MPSIREQIDLLSRRAEQDHLQSMLAVLLTAPHRTARADRLFKRDVDDHIEREPQP
jgi:Trp operon repressor